MESLNEKKANEIARDMLPYNNAEYHACYNSAMKAMQWKEEQFSIERKQLIEKANQAVTQSFENGAIFKKQKLIDKACEWIKDNIKNYVWCRFDEICISENIEKDFKKAMKGE